MPTALVVWSEGKANEMMGMGLAWQHWLMGSQTGSLKSGRPGGLPP